MFSNTLSFLSSRNVSDQVTDLPSKSVLKCTEAVKKKRKERRLSLPSAALWQIN